MTSDLGELSTPAPSQVALLSPLFWGLGIFSFFSGLCFLPQMAAGGTNGPNHRAAQTFSPPLPRNSPLCHQPRPKAIFAPTPRSSSFAPQVPNPGKALNTPRGFLGVTVSWTQSRKQFDHSRGWDLCRFPWSPARQAQPWSLQQESLNLRVC